MKAPRVCVQAGNINGQHNAVPLWSATLMSVFSSISEAATAWTTRYGSALRSFHNELHVNEDLSRIDDSERFHTMTHLVETYGATAARPYYIALFRALLRKDPCWRAFVTEASMSRSETSQLAETISEQMYDGLRPELRRRFVLFKRVLPILLSPLRLSSFCKNTSLTGTPLFEWVRHGVVSSNAASKAIELLNPGDTSHYLEIRVESTGMGPDRMIFHLRQQSDRPSPPPDVYQTGPVTVSLFLDPQATINGNYLVVCPLEGVGVWHFISADGVRKHSIRGIAGLTPLDVPPNVLHDLLLFPGSCGGEVFKKGSRIGIQSIQTEEEIVVSDPSTADGSAGDEGL